VECLDFCPYQTNTRVSQVGHNFNLKPPLFREVTENILTKILYFKPCHVSLWGFMYQLLVSRASREPCVALIVGLSWMNMKYKTDRAVRASARACGTLMCTFKSKCWDSRFSVHHRRANNQDSGKEANHGMCHKPTHRLWLLTQCRNQSPWCVAVAQSASGSTGPVQSGLP
jgi:hypothetical protein